MTTQRPRMWKMIATYAALIILCAIVLYPVMLVCKKAFEPGRQFEQLLEAQVRQVALGAPLDGDRPLVVARHAGPQQVELGCIADLPRELCLPQRALGLDER